jgi:two-component system sensor histidine kinase SenX3
LRIFQKNAFDIRASRSTGIRAFFAFWSTALIAIAALLVTVAVLQYRWTDQASSGEEMRIGAELESLMMKWHGDLYSELSAICIAMQVGPDSGARDTWKDYLDRYVEWNYALPHETLPNIYRNPDLVRDVYILDANHQSQPRLLLLNIDNKRIEPESPPPADMIALLARLQSNSSSLSIALDAWRRPGLQHGLLSPTEIDSTKRQSGSNSMTGWQFDDSVPAIVHPILHRSTGEALSSRSPVDWIIITLDMNVLQNRILPELATRYFGGLDGLDYRVGVIATGNRPRTIYSSDPGFGEQDIKEADSAINIFGPALETAQKSSDSKATPPNSLKSTEWRSFIAPTWFPVIDYASTPDTWILKLQRRAGPLQAVVSRVRRRNLSVSALVLLLLALNIAVLTSAGYRAQHFAKLQMEFVASVSHELRTPLSAIFSAGENIKDGVVTDKLGLKEYGSIIVSQSRHLMDNIDRILLFASIRSGKDRYNVQPLDASEIFRRVRNNTTTLLLEESCVLDQHIDSIVPRLMGDPVAVCGCLENLVTNAVKYSRDDRRIHMSASREWTETHGYRVAISVEDHGIGIRHSDLKHIFEPFFRSPEAVAAQIHGTGLGLSLAKHLAEVMNGSLSVVSEVGVGSIFTLHLPVPIAEQQSLVTVVSVSKEVSENE